METYSAIVFLVEHRAYKLKRAVEFDYLDFSSAERRQAMCEAEGRLNRRAAPSVSPVDRERTRHARDVGRIARGAPCLRIRAPLPRRSARAQHRLARWPADAVRRVEFNDAIACTDVLYDVAFLLMDLWRRDLPRHANVAANRYLGDTGDLSGIPLLPLFLSCRAAVRAKTSATAARTSQWTGMSCGVTARP